VPHIRPAPDWLETRSGASGAPVMNAVLRRRFGAGWSNERWRDCNPSCAILPLKISGKPYGKFKDGLSRCVQWSLATLWGSSPVFETWAAVPSLLLPASQHLEMVGFRVAGCPKPLAWDELGHNSMVVKVRLNMGPPMIIQV
jgi:hypothetical protein